LAITTPFLVELTVRLSEILGVYDENTIEEHGLTILEVIAQQAITNSTIMMTS